jgi:uncharacterized membrane protein YfcA
LKIHIIINKFTKESLMSNKYNKVAAASSVIFIALLMYTATINYSHDKKILSPIILALVCITITFIISLFAYKKKIRLPPSFQLFGVLFIFLALYLGEIQSFYIRFWWWDLILHSLFGCYTLFVSLHMIKGVIRKEVEITKKRFTVFLVIFAFSFTIALGTLWELFEFSGDYFFGKDMIKGGLEDTATDLLVKTASAFITSLIYYNKNKNK